jgi:DNA-binding CsgD family transcriptional regulator
MSGSAVRKVESIEVRRIGARGTTPAGGDPRVAFYRGEYDLAATLARKLPAPEARLLQARIALRLRRPQEAVELLARWRSAGDRRKDAERAILLASAFERLGDAASAAALYDEPRGAGSALEHERAYLRAYGHWLRGEYDQAEGLLGEQRSGDELAHGRWADLLGRIAVSRRDYPVAARRFEAALGAFDAMPTPDEGARVAALAGLATVAVETLAFDLHGRLAAGYERSLRTQGTKPLLFRIGRSLVLLDGLQGDDEAAFRTATALQNQAEQTSERVLAHVTLAEFLRVRGDRTGPKLYLELAAQALRAEPRTRGGAGDVTAALLYVVEASYSDPHAAAEVLARVLPAGGRPDPAAGAEHGSRAAALVLYARGRSAIALGETGTGAELVHAARAIWHEHGYHYRVAVVDLDLAEMFGDRAALENARQVVDELPSSWLVRKADRIEKRLASGLGNLSPAERRVLRELCAGKSNREIAAALERSESTIRNQTQRIFDVLGVNSRAALVARCIDLGL